MLRLTVVLGQGRGELVVVAWMSSMTTLLCGEYWLMERMWRGEIRLCSDLELIAGSGRLYGQLI